MALSGIKPPHPYFSAATALGLCILVFVLSTGELHATSLLFWILAACVVAGELFPIQIPHKNETLWVTTSGTFAFALIIISGIPGGVLTLVSVSLAYDLWSKKPLWKIGFNVAQYTLAVAGAGFVLQSLGEFPHTTPPYFFGSDLPAILAAGTTFFLVNWSLSSVGVALSTGAPVLTTLRHNLGLDTAADGVLLTLSPIVLAAANHTLWLVPFLAFPMLAAYYTLRVSQKNLSLVEIVRLEAEKNRHLALHDSLTGLPNRTLLKERTQAAILTAQQTQTSLAVLLMDLDRFKEINDALGHHNGDRLLKEVSQRLTGVVRAGDTVARLGGDEFALLIRSLRQPENALTVTETLLRSFDDPFSLEELSLKVEASLGLAIYPQHGTDTESLMRHADVAMYRSKDTHTGYEVYQSSKDQHTRDRLALVESLRDAVNQGAFDLHYQPKVNLRTGKVLGVETLLRWYNDGKLIPPDLFIPLAEHTGLIRPLTVWVVESAVRQCRQWEDEGIHLNVAVNLSMRDLFDLELPNQIAQTLTRWWLPPSRLELEITESSIAADPVRAENVLNELDAMGLTLSIDDFGTGHSSLSRLKRLPVGELKIDRSFVTNMARDESDAAIVRSIIDLGHNLGLRVVAEGLEAQEVLDKLIGLGCDVVQGFYVSKAVTAPELLTWQRSFDWSVLADKLAPGPSANPYEPQELRGRDSNPQPTG